VASTVVGGLGNNAGARMVRRVIALAYVGVLVLVPMVVITWKTVRPGPVAFWHAISSQQALTAFRLTAEISLAAVAINTVFGVGVSLLITRSRFPGRRALSALVDLPISVSPIVVGLALVLVYGPETGWFGKGLHDIGFNVIYSVPGMILATTFVSMPLILREIVPVLVEEGIDQEQAARVLGASTWQRFARITLPTIRPALMYGIVLSLARSIGEYGAVLVVSGNVSGQGQTQTVPLLVSERVEQLEPGSYQLAFLLIVVTILAIVLVSLRRGKGEPDYLVPDDGIAAVEAGGVPLGTLAAAAEPAIQNDLVPQDDAPQDETAADEGGLR
jgi:sulfate/thiosulfate transport system permease protein